MECVYVQQDIKISVPQRLSSSKILETCPVNPDRQQKTQLPSRIMNAKERKLIVLIVTDHSLMVLLLMEIILIYVSDQG